jgi:predicted transcriptional regulator
MVRKIDKESDKKAVKDSLKNRLSRFDKNQVITPETEPLYDQSVKSAPYTVQQKAIVNLAAAGWSVKEIAKQLGCSDRIVKNVMKSPTGSLAIERIQQEIYIKEPQKIAQYMAPKAMKTLFDIMTSMKSKETSRVEAAKAVLDRAYGKPLQQIEQKGNTVADLFRELDNREKQKDLVPDFYDVEKELQQHGSTYDGEDEASEDSPEEV